MKTNANNQIATTKRKYAEDNFNPKFWERKNDRFVSIDLSSILRMKRTNMLQSADSSLSRIEWNRESLKFSPTEINLRNNNYKKKKLGGREMHSNPNNSYIQLESDEFEKNPMSKKKTLHTILTMFPNEISHPRYSPSTTNFFSPPYISIPAPCSQLSPTKDRGLF